MSGRVGRHVRGEGPASRQTGIAAQADDTPSWTTDDPAGVEEVTAEVATTTRSFREPSYFVLASLLDGPQHGYGIIKAADRLSDGVVRLAPGTLYGALDRLSASGLIVSDREEVVAGRARHYYRLTETGQHLLLEEANRMAHAARAVLGRLAAPPAEVAAG